MLIPHKEVAYVSLNDSRLDDQHPPTVSPKENVRRAQMLLHTTNAVELLVIDNGKLVGMLNERDIWHHCPTSTVMMDDEHVNDLLEQFRVGAVMALHPPVIGPEAHMSEAAALFATSDREGIPVLEDGIPIGFLTEATVMHAASVLLSRDGKKDTPRDSSSMTTEMLTGEKADD